MPSPALVFGLLLATLYGAAFHLIFGGNLRRLLLFLVAAWLGFALGQAFAVASGVRLLPVGQLNLFSATLGAWLALLATHFLTNFPQQNK